ncbi:MAG: DUF1064 domain-containing protein [Ruthenibacterium sp.]
MSKYNSQKVTYNGINFESKKECGRYRELLLLERAGKIQNLMLQPRYTLQEAFRRNGKAIRKIEYVADFCYCADGKSIVEDVKGMKTDVYKLKKKLFLCKYPNADFREV